MAGLCQEVTTKLDKLEDAVGKAVERDEAGGTKRTKRVEMRMPVMTLKMMEEASLELAKRGKSVLGLVFLFRSDDSYLC